MKCMKLFESWWEASRVCWRGGGGWRALGFDLRISKALLPLIMPCPSPSPSPSQLLSLPTSQPQSFLLCLSSSPSRLSFYFLLVIFLLIATFLCFIEFLFSSPLFISLHFSIYWPFFLFYIHTKLIHSCLSSKLSFAFHFQVRPLLSFISYSVTSHLILLCLLAPLPPPI